MLSEQIERCVLHHHFLSLNTWLTLKGPRSGLGLTVHVGGLLAGEKYPCVELPQQKLLLPGLKDVLHQPGVVDIGAVEADAEPLLHFKRRPRAEGLGHLPGPLAPVAGGHRR